MVGCEFCLKRGVGCAVTVHGFFSENQVTMSLHNARQLLLEFPAGRLRRVRTADLADFQAYRKLPELGLYQGWSPMADAEALAFLAEMQAARLFAPGTWVQLGIAEAVSDRLIGDIGVFVSEDAQWSEIGFTLEPAFQGRGIASNAVRQALQLLFDSTGVARVFGISDLRNAASIRLLERLGFVHQETRATTFRAEACTETVYLLARDLLR
jgi:RimJ/RimL family protein N-acetyltransferase